MHWLPLVAMVIASALPFPHDPVSRIAAATTDPHRAHRHDRTTRLAANTVDYDFHGNSSQTDFNVADALRRKTNRENLQNVKDYVKSSVDEQTSVLKMENRENYQLNSNSGGDYKSGDNWDVSTGRGTLRIENNSELKDYKSDSLSHFVDLSKKENLLDSTARLLQVPTTEAPNSVSPAANPNSQKGPESTTTPLGTGNQRTTTAGRAPAEENFNLEAALGLGPSLDLEGDEMFLDAHPRVLFSPSPLPPEHPPLLLMLETGLLDEDRDREEQEDMDGHIEGHGDRAIDRGTTPSWADSSRVISEVPRAVKRDKRSQSAYRRSGEKSVCESESAWVTNKTTAIDSHGQRVTILQEIQTQTGPLKQYFYETRCRQAERQSSVSRSKGAAAKPNGTGVAGAGCLGVDKKQWVSKCKAKQSYVRALTRDANNRTGWRWIRIDSSCVCVLLSRTNQAIAREVLTRTGRG